MSQLPHLTIGTCFGHIIQLAPAQGGSTMQIKCMDGARLSIRDALLLSDGLRAMVAQIRMAPVHPSPIAVENGNTP